MMFKNEKLEFKKIPIKDIIKKSKKFYEIISKRRSVRDFDSKKIDLKIIKNAILSAGSAPNGANLQPWHFVIIKDKKIKKKIRIAAENEEKEFYEKKAPKEWLKALEPLGTDANKAFLETAPYLIGIFVKNYGTLPDGTRVKHYYATESVGIATGILITALHNAGLATLTHTPSPMGFLNKIFKRPKNERPFLLLVAGYAEKEAQVPDIQKFSLNEISSYIG